LKEKTTMRTSILISAVVACALAAPIAGAQDKHAHDKPAPSMEQDAHTGQMQEKMKAMQAQMDRIHRTTDPKERQKLMQEHMQAMLASMKAMHGMGGPMMKSGGEHAGMTMGDKKGGMKGGMKEGDMMKRHAMMEKRMDMMQMMMEQMVQRDHAMQSMPAR
jgi:hypothetical protein